MAKKSGFDLIYNGVGYGSVAQALLDEDFQPGFLRPYKTDKKRGSPSFVTLNVKGKHRRVVSNAPATLLKDEWIQIDRDVRRAALPKLKFWGDIRDAVPYVLSDGLLPIMLQYQTGTEISPATISMDAVRESERDRFLYDLRNHPVPIIHKDGRFSLREVRVSRRGGQPLDTTYLRRAARRVAEEAEKLSIGVTSSYSYGGASVYGITNFPDRLTMTITAPTDPGWSSQTMNDEVMDAIQLLSDNYYDGPFGLYVSKPFRKFLNYDFSPAYNRGTLRNRLLENEEIARVGVLDYLTGYQFALVQMDEDTIQAVEGMPITTFQWETQGGWELNMKVVAIMVPRLKSDQNNKTGLLHAA